MQHLIDNLQVGDYIAFGFDYNGGYPKEIIVDKISFVHTDSVVVHFMYGTRAMSERVMKKDIIAIGAYDAKDTIPGWGGYYHILNPHHKLLKSRQKA